MSGDDPRDTGDSCDDFARVPHTYPLQGPSTACPRQLTQSRRTIEHVLQGLSVEDPVGPGFKLGFPGLVQALVGPGR